MADRTVTVTVHRYDPARDVAPRMQAFAVPSTQGLSILEALDYIYENLDATLAYYDHAACAQGICKTCVVKINGKAGLLCQTLLTEDVTLEPAGKLKVVRDLVTETGGRAS